MSDSLEVMFEQALEMQQQQHYPEAMALYERILARNPKHLPSLHAMGVIKARLGDLHVALDYLQQAVHIAPDDASVHNSLGNALRANNQPEKALRHYRQALHIAPDFTEAHYQCGLLFLNTQRLEQARIQFNNVLELYPEHIGARFYLGVISLNANQLPEAEKAFQQVLEIDNTQAEAFSNLGVIALKRDQGQLAVDYFTKALAYNNELVDARNNLAATFMHYDRFENALIHYDYLLKHAPDNIEFLYNSGVAEMALGHLAKAIGHFEHVLRQNPEHFAALNNLAAIHIRLENREKARELLKKAIKINKKDAASQHMLNALEGGQSTTDTCSEYAQNLFNNYSLYYDKHMQETLHYSLPQQLAQRLDELNLHTLASALDLGCGTGLIGEILRPRTQHLVGVDIAKKMLAQAREKHCYDALHQAEIIEFLKSCKSTHDLITLIDVLPYFADLQELFTLLTPRLNSAGLLVLTTEISEHSPWLLQQTGRFCHQAEYIQALCKTHQLRVVKQIQLTARMQESAGLKENLFIAQR